MGIAVVSRESEWDPQHELRVARYLVELLQQEAFIANSIDTSWLDGLIKEKSVTLRYNINDVPWHLNATPTPFKWPFRVEFNGIQVVFYAAVFRAVQNLKVFDAEVESALSMGQLGPLREMVGAPAPTLWADACGRGAGPYQTVYSIQYIPSIIHAVLKSIANIEKQHKIS